MINHSAIGKEKRGSCVSFKITYPLKDVPNLSGNYFSSYSLAVKEFEDLRAPDSVRFNLLGKGLQQQADSIIRDDQKWYVNTENYYKDHVTSPWVTKMVANHIVASKLFKEAKVSDDTKLEQDFLLEGKIEKFDAYKESTTSTKIGQAFGLIGVLATMGAKSEYEATTVLIDLKLTDLKQNKIVWNGKAEGKVSGSDYADPYGWSVYEKANQSLKMAVNQLIHELAEFGKGRS